MKTKQISNWLDSFWSTLKSQLIAVYPGIWTSYDEPNRIMYIGLDAVSGSAKAIARHVLPAGTAAGSAADDVWYRRDLNNLWVSSAWGASLSNNLLTLPAGTYLVRWWVRYPPVVLLRVGIFDSNGNPLLNQSGFNYSGGIWIREQCKGEDVLVLNAQTSIQLMAIHDYAFSGYAGSNKGTPNSSPPLFDVTLPITYSFLSVEKLA